MNQIRAEINIVSDYLLQDKPVIIPTDTIYGFSCLPNAFKAIEKIISLKKRDQNKPFLLLDTNIARIKSLLTEDSFSLSFIDQIVAKKLWPGPLTIIAEKNKNINLKFLKNFQTVGIRYPKNDYLKAIIKKTSRPILSTSINLSGEKEITNLHTIKERYNNKIDFITKIEIQRTISSVIVLLSAKEKKVKLLRKTGTDYEKKLIIFLNNKGYI